VRLRLRQHYGIIDAELNIAHDAGRRRSNRTSIGLLRDWQPWGQLGCSGTDDDGGGSSDSGASSADNTDSFISAHGDNHDAVSDRRNHRNYRNIDRLLNTFISEQEWP
jgi:hypothetical protein